MIAIIFGSSGQDGYYLSKLLKEEGIEVICASRTSTTTKGNVADYNFVESLIKKYKPSYIFHFSANSTTRHDALFDNHGAISTGTLNILEGARQHSPSAKIFLSGSAMQFKNDGQPINELTPFEASSPYSIARIQSTYAGRYYRSRFGMSVYTGYFFNHDSPLRTERHVNQKIVSALKKILAGSEEKLNLGNIEVKKEFNYAGDIVKAIWLLVNQEKVYEAVIGCGLAYSIKDWLEYCFSKFNRNWKDYVVLSENFTSEYNVLVSDPKVIKSCGWRPDVSFQNLADMMIDKT